MVNTLLVVDDHEAFRSFVSTLLNGDRFVVTGIAEDGESALDAIDSLHPDVVLLDIQLPGIDGFEVAHRLAVSTQRPAVVLTSTRDAADFGARLTNAPVLGFVAKHEMSVAAITALLDAGPVDDPKT
jgi:CheY-like chemotaxis protein